MSEKTSEKQKTQKGTKGIDEVKTELENEETEEYLTKYPDRDQCKKPILKRKTESGRGRIGLKTKASMSSMSGHDTDWKAQRRRNINQK